VGFGSSAPGGPAAGPRRGNAAGAGGGLDDVSQALSKGFTQACTVAGARAATRLENLRETKSAGAWKGAGLMPVCVRHVQCREECY
jgi:hypothetical protein